jgi:cytidylate kinase
MICGIFGPSCCGKTTVANAASAELHLALRSCGNEVRKLADKQRISIDQLTDENHQRVDQETITWAVANRPCLVEGLSLDAVFTNAGQPATLILMYATDHQRVRRGREKYGDFDLEKLRQIDNADTRLRGRLYPTSASRGVDLLTLDTSALTLNECASQVVKIIRTRCPTGRHG